MAGNTGRQQDLWAIQTCLGGFGSKLRTLRDNICPRSTGWIWIADSVMFKHSPVYVGEKSDISQGSKCCCLTENKVYTEVL